MDADFQHDVFLSHNANDKPRVRRLAERLRAAGLRHSNFGFRISAGGGPAASGAGIGLGGAGAQHRAASRSGQRLTPLPFPITRNQAGVQNAHVKTPIARQSAAR